MEWMLFPLLLIHMVFATESFNYLSLLDTLHMSNPMIIGELRYLRNQNMFHLMKNVMMLNQSICLTTTIQNNTLQRSAGIIFKTNTSTFNDQITHIQKPWIIIDKKPEKFSPIDVPLYFLTNEMIWEHYELKYMRKSNYLGRFNGETFIWNQNISRHLFERRGNFNNITLFGMTESELTFNQLPTDLKKFGKLSKEMSDSYEVKPKVCSF